VLSKWGNKRSCFSPAKPLGQHGVGSGAKLSHQHLIVSGGPPPEEPEDEHANPQTTQACPAPSGRKHPKPSRERAQSLTARQDFDTVVVPLQHGYDSVDTFRQIRASKPVGEQIDVTTGAVSDAVGSNDVPTGQRESERSRSFQRDHSDVARGLAWTVGADLHNIAPIPAIAATTQYAILGDLARIQRADNSIGR
jgi:hypothetical protein